MNGRWVILLMLLVAATAGARTGIVTTRDGQELAGEVTFSPVGGLVVVSAKEGRPVAWNAVQSVRFSGGDVATNLPGWRVGLRSGTVLPVELGDGDAQAVNFVCAGQKLRLRTTDIAMLWERTARVGAWTNQIGALLLNGDTLAGEFAGIEGARLKLNSVLFGLRRLEFGKEAVIVRLWSGKIAVSRFEVQMRSGAVYCSADAPARATGDALMVREGILGALTLPMAEVVEIRVRQVQ